MYAVIAEASSKARLVDCGGHYSDVASIWLVIARDDNLPRIISRKPLRHSALSLIVNVIEFGSVTNVVCSRGLWGGFGVSCVCTVAVML
jgi:hypothetical protein